MHDSLEKAKPIFCGIDLAAREKNPTGAICVDWNGKSLEEGLLFDDCNIHKFIKRNKPTIIAIDAPLSLPDTGNVREEDRTLLKMGFGLFPFFQSMRELAARGMELSRTYENSIVIIEVCPSVSAKILGIQREKNKVRRHLEDAKIAVKTAIMFYEGKRDLVGGRFYVPRRQAQD